MMKRRYGRSELVGKRFGRLVAIRPTKRRCGSNVIWECRCDCNNTTFVPTSSLRSGATKSCGCLYKESVSKSNTTHGLSNSPEWHVWVGMKNRCSNKKNKYYGKRGIKVCKRWKESFLNFLKDMGERPSPKLTIERINNNKGYFPKNCKWGTKKEQANNKRQRNIDIGGKKFERLIAIKPTKKRNGGGSILWKCKCDCGNYTFVSVSNLRNSITKSCGCLRKELSLKRCKELLRVGEVLL